MPSHNLAPNQAIQTFQSGSPNSVPGMPPLEAVSPDPFLSVEAAAEQALVEAEIGPTHDPHAVAKWREENISLGDRNADLEELEAVRPGSTTELSSDLGSAASGLIHDAEGVLTAAGLEPPPGKRPTRRQTGLMKTSVDERAQLFLDSMGFDGGGDVTEQVAQRIKHEDGRREDAPVFNSLSYIERQLEECRGDTDALIETAASLMGRDEKGRTREVDEEGVLKIISAIPKESIGDAYIKHPAEFATLADSTAGIEISPASLDAHLRGIKLVEEITGKQAFTWRGEARASDNIPDAARKYSERPFLAYAVFHDARIHMAEVRQKGLSPDELAKEQQMFTSKAGDALRYIMDTDQSPVRADLLSKFMQGDILRYGFNRNGNSEGALAETNALFDEIVGNYLINVDTLGLDGAEELHQRLGTVNFGIYQPKTVTNMYDILHNPQSHPEVNVLVRGQDGDHSGVIGKTMAHGHLKETVVFEVNTAGEMDKVNATLDEIGSPVNKLTIFGHGDEKGIHISNNFILQRDIPSLKNPAVRRLLMRIRPNADGTKHVVLGSCSQGKKYKGGSMAELISEVEPQAAVAAAPEVAYIMPRGQEGEFVIITNKYYNLAKSIEEKYPRVPGVKRLTAWLLAEKRNKVGSVVVHGGKTEKDSSGIIKVGA